MSSFVSAPCAWSPIFHDKSAYMAAHPKGPADKAPKGEVYHPASSTVQLTEEDTKKLKTALQECRAAKDKTYFDSAADTADRDRYYGDSLKNAGSMSGDQLYSTLSKLISKTHVNQLPYDPAQQLYPWIDRHPDGEIESIYSGRKADPEEVILADIQAGHLEKAKQEELAAEKGVTVGKNGQLSVVEPHFAYNCEHVVPQSWFHKKLPERGDLHHLFACETGCNSLRGNAMYSDAPDVENDSCGALTTDHKRFEPAGGKGAVSRATLYFLLRYPGEIGDASGEYTSADLKTLLEWNRENPVTEYEHHRNEEIFKKQGNRNPLIDFPELAEKINFGLGLGTVGQGLKIAA